MKKRVISLFLMMILIASSFSMFKFSASANVRKVNIQTSIDKVLAKHPDGSFFSKNGRTCNPSGASGSHKTNNCSVYKLHNRCIGFVRYATAIMYGMGKTNETYNYTWGGNEYYKKIGSASISSISQTADLLKKAKKGDVVEVVKNNSSRHVMIFLSVDEECENGEFKSFHANWGRNCDVRYDHKVNFSKATDYKGAQMTVYRARNYEYLYGNNGDGVDGPIVEPVIKLKANIKFEKIDEPYLTEIGVRLRINNPSYSHIENYGVEYRKSGTSKFKTVKTVKIDNHKAWRKQYVKISKLVMNTKYDIRAFVKIDGQTLYTPIRKSVRTKHIHSFANNNRCITCRVRRPSKPTSVKYSAVRNGQIKISWKKEKGFTYTVEMATNPNGSFKSVAQTTKNSFTQKRLKKGSNYYFRIRRTRQINGTRASSKYTKTKKVSS